MTGQIVLSVVQIRIMFSAAGPYVIALNVCGFSWFFQENHGITCTSTFITVSVRIVEQINSIRQSNSFEFSQTKALSMQWLSGVSPCSDPLLSRAYFARLSWSGSQEFLCGWICSECAKAPVWVIVLLRELWDVPHDLSCFFIFLMWVFSY